jgi:hypothetical protein
MSILVRLVPVLLRAHPVRRTRRELHDDLSEAERAVHRVEHVEAVDDLVLDLAGRAVDMRVVLHEAPDAEQAVQHARQLVAVAETELRQLERQLLVGAQPRPVDETRAGTVHRLDREVAVLLLDEVHVVPVVVVVAGSVPELVGQDDGGANLLVAALHQFLAHEVFQLAPDDDAAGVPEGVAGRLLVEAEEVELRAQLAVVALLRLLDDLEVLRQLLLREERGAAHALHRDAGRLAAPVGSRRGDELERRDVAERFDVPAAAHVGEAVAVAIEGDHVPVETQLLQVLGLEPVAEPAQFALRRVGIQLRALERQAGRLELGHARLDPLQVLGRERLLDDEVVVEPLLGRRTEPELGFREELEHGGGAEVRGRVPQAVDCLGALLRDDPELRVAEDALVQRAEVAVEIGGQGGAGESGADLGSGVAAGRALLDLEGLAVGEGDASDGAHEGKRTMNGIEYIRSFGGRSRALSAAPARPPTASRS